MTQAKGAIRKVKMGSTAIRALAIGAVAFGAAAIGALAVGAMTIRRLRVLEARIEKFSIDTLTAFLRGSIFLTLPALLPLPLLIYWFLRVRFSKAYNNQLPIERMEVSRLPPSCRHAGV
jgi:hypothetical protein